MGLLDKFSSSHSTTAATPTAKLPVPAQPIGYFPQYTTHTNEIIFKLTEAKFAVQNSFTVRDAAGAAVFHVDGKLMTMHNRMSVTDASHKPIYSLSKKLMSIHTAYVAEEPFEHKATYFTITKSGSKGNRSLVVTFENVAAGGLATSAATTGVTTAGTTGVAGTTTAPASTRGVKAQLELRGDWIGKEAEIHYLGTPVARIARSFTNGLMDKDTYHISVAAHVDAASCARRRCYHRWYLHCDG